MATHSSILAWKILWTEESVRLQSMGSQESDTDRVTEHTCMMPTVNNKDTPITWEIRRAIF